MKHPMKKLRVDFDFERTLLGYADNSDETYVPTDRVVRSRGDGSQYPRRLEEVRERHPWTSEAWNRLDEICDGSMPDDAKIRLAVDVSDFVDGNFFSHAIPQTRKQTHEKMSKVAETCQHLVSLLQNDDEVRSLKGESFSVKLVAKLEALSRSADAMAIVTSDEMKVDRSRGNTVQQDLLLYRLTEYFQASGASLSRTLEYGNPKGKFAEYLGLIWTLLPDDLVPDKAATFIRRGFSVAQKFLADDKANKSDGRDL